MSNTKTYLLLFNVDESIDSGTILLAFSTGSIISWKATFSQTISLNALCLSFSICKMRIRVLTPGFLTRIKCVRVLKCLG